MKVPERADALSPSETRQLPQVVERDLADSIAET